MSMDVNYKKIYSEQSVTNIKNHAILCNVYPDPELCLDPEIGNFIYHFWRVISGLCVL